MSESLALPHDAASAAVARRAIGAWLAAEHVPMPARDDAVLVISELVGNSIRHGRALPDGSLHVAWALDGSELLVEVRDGGGGMPSLRRANRYDASGRGLAIVDRVARSWGVRAENGETLVWAVLRVHAMTSVADRDGATSSEVQQPEHRHRDLRDRGHQLVG